VLELRSEAEGFRLEQTDTGATAHATTHATGRGGDGILLHQSF
jgi:hypothetical protein